MSSPLFLKNIAIVGASGSLGTPTLQSLLEINQSTITAISRHDSTAVFPTGVRVLKGDYSSHDFLVSALRGQDALVLILSIDAMDKQFAFISAAAEAGVKWIFPTEYGSDTTHEELTAAIPVLESKIHVRKAIEEAGLRWVGLINNPWLDYCLHRGLYDIDVANRKAIVYDNSAAFDMTVLATSALALARLLSLPVEDTEDGLPALNKYADRPVFVSSGLVTQPQVFELVKKASETTDADWEITHAQADDKIREAHEELAKGNMLGGAYLMFGYMMKEGMGGNYSKTKGLDNEILELPEEDLLAAVKAALL